MKKSIIQNISLISSFVARKCNNQSDLQKFIKQYELTESEIVEIKDLINFKVYKYKEI